MIKAIVFDCFGVLTADSWQEFVNSLPKSADVEAARQAHRSYNASQLSKLKCTKRILAATGQIFTELEDYHGEFTKNSGLLKYISQLKSHYKIAILSNVASNWIRDSLLTKSEQALFDDMIFSYEAGMVKPEPALFELACKRLNVQPQETVLVDDKEIYCKAAQSQGWQAITYGHLSQLKEDLEKLLK